MQGATAISTQNPIFGSLDAISLQGNRKPCCGACIYPIQRPQQLVCSASWLAAVLRGQCVIPTAVSVVVV